MVQTMQSDLEGNVPRVIIDVHELKGKRVNAVKILMDLLENENIPYVIQALPVGDILASGGIVIERKTVQDLVNTLKGSSNGVLRFQQQMRQISENYSHPYLLIENILAIREDPRNRCIYVPFKTTKKSGGRIYFTVEQRINIHPSSLRGLLEKAKDMGITILEGFDAVHSAGLLFSLIKNEERKQSSTSLPSIRSRKKINTMSDEQEFFLSGLPKINTSRARQILMTFKTPLNALNHVDEWREINGIGPKIVESVMQVLNSEYEAPPDVVPDESHKDPRHHPEGPLDEFIDD